MRRVLTPILMSIVIAAYANAAIVFSNNFDTENNGVPALGTTTLATFEVRSGNVDLIGTANGSSYDFYPGHGLYLDLDGSGEVTNAMIASNVTFAPGQYTLSFLLGSNPNAGAAVNTLVVSLGEFSEVFTTTGVQPFAPVNLAFTTNVSGALTFAQSGAADEHGSLVDDIQLTAVPEPGSILTMVTGLCVLAATRRMRRWPR